MNYKFVFIFQNVIESKWIFDFYYPGKKSSYWLLLHSLKS